MRLEKKTAHWGFPRLRAELLVSLRRVGFAVRLVLMRQKAEDTVRSDSGA
jgi:hypothetical protein